MTQAILPCNGLDKPFGPLAREAALALANGGAGAIVCPVLLNQAPERYKDLLSDKPLLVIDGCATRCATKLAARLNLKIGRKLLIADEVKQSPVKPENILTPGPAAREFIRNLVAAQTAAGREETPAGGAGEFPPPVEFLTVTYDKFVFKIPAAGFYFNENDFWVQPVGRRARIGVTDFAQQRLTDIAFFDPPEIGLVVEQFGEAGVIESVKAVSEIISPVAGRVVAVNTALVEKPEQINADPYGQGWIVELELADFEADRELLAEPAAYADIVHKKAAAA